VAQVWAAAVVLGGLHGELTVGVWDEARGSVREGCVVVGV
jgi:hypothetical protein